MKLASKIVCPLAAILISCSVHADNIFVFPMTNYDQNPNTWISPTAPDYNTSVMTPSIQSARYANFLSHYDGALSPWNANFVNGSLQQSPTLTYIENWLLDKYDNSKQTAADKITYGENYLPYNAAWITALKS